MTGYCSHFDAKREIFTLYRKTVVMPNHCHVLIELIEGVALGKIVLSWNSRGGSSINTRAALGCGDSRRAMKSRPFDCIEAADS